MLLAVDPPIATEIVTTGIIQLGSLLGIILTGALGVVAARRSKRAEGHSAKAAEDAAVVRAETRNAHNPDQPMRHDMDQILANQQQALLAQEQFQTQIIEKFEGHDRALSSIHANDAKQWAAINSALEIATNAVTASSDAVHAAEMTITEAVRIIFPGSSNS